MNALLNHLRRARAGLLASTPDGELLARYLATGDEPAFEELVQRHGPAVYGACHRHLPDPADAADAFQAVWLVLVRRAEKLAGRSALGPWLFQVAVWTARNLRRKNARRLAVTGPSAESLPDPSPDLADLRLDLDAALAALPEKYRTPVVLCHLEGWSRRDAAAHLGCPEGTLSALLSRALAKLRKQLGADPIPLLTLVGVTVPTGLATAAVRAADVFRTASLSTVGVSPAVADLTRGVLRMFWVKKVVATGLVLVVTLGMGIGIGFHPGATAQTPQPTKKAEPTAKELQQRLTQLREEAVALEKQLDEAQRRELIEKQVLVFRQQREARARLAEVFKHADVIVVPRLEVVLRPGQGIEIHELEKGQKVGVALCSNLDVAKRFLLRTHADPKGPKELTVRADPECPWAEVKALLDAVKAAGYTGVSYSGVLPNAGRGVTVQGKFVPGSNLYSVDQPVELDLRQIDLKGTAAQYVLEAPDIIAIDAHFVGEIGTHISLREPLADKYLIRPDGTVSLGKYGSVAVSGLTLAKANEAIRKRLADVTRKNGETVAGSDLVVQLDVVEANSKAFYVILTGADRDAVHRFPCTGNETVLDAIASVSGLPAQFVGGKIWVQRGEQTLPVDWSGITKEGKTATNYQIMPGDRVYVQPASRRP